MKEKIKRSFNEFFYTYLTAIVVGYTLFWVGFVAGSIKKEKEVMQEYEQCISTAQTCVQLYVECNTTLVKCVDKLHYFNNTFLNHHKAHK